MHPSVTPKRAESCAQRKSCYLLFFGIYYHLISPQRKTRLQRLNEMGTRTDVMLGALDDLLRHHIPRSMLACIHLAVTPGAQIRSDRRMPNRGKRR